MAMAPPRAPQASAGPGPGSSAGVGPGAVGAAEGAELRLLMERLELLSQQRALASVRSQRLMHFLHTAGATGHGTAHGTANGRGHRTANGTVNGAVNGMANGAVNFTARAATSSSSASPPSASPPSASPSPPPHYPFVSSSFSQHHPAPFAPCPDAGHPTYTSPAAGTVPPQRPGMRSDGHGLSHGDCAWQPQLQPPPYPMLECGDVRRPRRSSADLALRSAEEIWAARGDAAADNATQARGRQRARRPRASLDLPSLSSSASPTAQAAFRFGERDHVVSSGAHPAPPLDKAIQRRHSGHSGRGASLDMPRSSGAVPTGHPHTRVCPVTTSGASAEDSYMRSFNSNSKAPSDSASRYSLGSTSSRRRRTVSFDMDSKAAQYYGGASTKQRPSPGPSPSPSPGVPAARSPWSECGAPPHGSTWNSTWTGGAGARMGPTGRPFMGDAAVAGMPVGTGAEGATQYFPAPPQAQARAAPFAPCSGNWLHLSPGGPWPQEPICVNALGAAFSTQQQQLMGGDASVRIIDADERSPGDVVMGESGLSGTSCYSVSPAPELVGSGMNSRSSSHSPTGALRSSGIILGLPLSPQDIRAFLEQRASDSDAETSAASDAEGFLGRPAMAQRRM